VVNAPSSIRLNMKSNSKTLQKLVLYNLPDRLKNALSFVFIRVLKQRLLIRQIPLGLGNIIYSGCRECRLCLKNALSFEFIRVLISSA
jgi:hypothetical protein